MLWLSTSIRNKIPTITSLQMLLLGKLTRKSGTSPPLEMSKSLFWVLLTKGKFHFLARKWKYQISDFLPLFLESSKSRILEQIFLPHLDPSSAGSSRKKQWPKPFPNYSETSFCIDRPKPFADYSGTFFCIDRAAVVGYALKSNIPSRTKAF